MAEARVTTSDFTSRTLTLYKKCLQILSTLRTVNAVALLVTLSSTTNSRTNTGIYTPLWNSAFLFFLTLCFHLIQIHLCPTSKPYSSEPFSLPGVKRDINNISIAHHAKAMLIHHWGISLSTGSFAEPRWTLAGHIPLYPNAHHVCSSSAILKRTAALNWN